jgi:hypothetical protein
VASFPVGNKSSASSNIKDIDGIKGKGKKETKGGPGSSGPGNGTSDSFNKFYNKELKVSEDEIPLVLTELNESALNYISREQFENALILLQKAHGVLEVLESGEGE